jgi:hypothetical protein
LTPKQGNPLDFSRTSLLLTACRKIRAWHNAIDTRSIGETMRKIRLEQLTPGMRLAQDVVNFSGQVLLYKGNPLQPKDIKNFKAWGIIEVAVESSTLTFSKTLNNNQINAKLLMEAQNETSKLFQHSNISHPVISELIRLSTLNKLKQKPGMENVNVY